MDEKQFYLDKINEAVRILFNPDTDPYAYDREKHNLCKYLYLYEEARLSGNTGESDKPDKTGKGLSYYKPSENTVELVETVERCLKSYSPDKGEFIHYFWTSYKKSVDIAHAKEKLSINSGGLHPTDSQREKMLAVYNFLKKHPKISLENMKSFLKEYAEETDQDLERAAQDILLYINFQANSMNAQMDQDPEALTLDDLLSNGQDFTETMERKDLIFRLIDCLEEEYRESRAQSKEVLAYWITSLILKYDHDGSYTYYMMKKSFYREEARVFYELQGRVMLKTEIAKATGKSAPNITQVVARFLDKVKASFRGDQ